MLMNYVRKQTRSRVNSPNHAQEDYNDTNDARQRRRPQQQKRQTHMPKIYPGVCAIPMFLPRASGGFQ